MINATTDENQFSSGCSTLDTPRYIAGGSEVTTLEVDSAAIPEVSGSQSATWLQKMAQRRLVKHLSGFKGGEIAFADSSGSMKLGEASEDALRAQLLVTNPALYSLITTQGAIGFAEAYLQGHWRSDNLTALLQILCRNLEATRNIVTDMGWQTRRAMAWFSRNTRDGSRRNIAAHYDLSNDLFELFLDPTMMYSSAWFDHENMSLHAASISKLDRICRKLDLQPEDSIVEIGTGWGGFALHSAAKYGCHVTTTTISERQLKKAGDRFAEEGLQDRINLLKSDYRDLQGQYDKLVSIEMIEAVGEKFLDGYFRSCDRLLKPGGKMAIQAIVMPEERYGHYRRRVDFVQKYIFPGGFLPSVAALQEASGRTSSLRLESVEDMSTHYARTLEIWRQRFLDRLDDVRALGFDDRFIRMWEYYLCYCEAAFREQAVRVVQIVWDKPVH